MSAFSRLLHKFFQIPSGVVTRRSLHSPYAVCSTTKSGVRAPDTGRNMEVWTTEPGVQLYTGNFLDGTLTGQGGKKYTKHYAFCLETQHYPDSVNQPKFPTVVLEPGKTFASQTIYKFGAK